MKIHIHYIINHAMWRYPRYFVNLSHDCTFSN